MIPQALKRAYEVNFRHRLTVYSIKVETEQTQVMSQKIILSNKCGPRGNNWVVLPIYAPHCPGKDVEFRDMIAHEFGKNGI